MSFDQAQGLPSLLAAFDPIMHAKRKGVCEGAGGRLETDAMLSQIALGFGWVPGNAHGSHRSDEHTSELQSLMRISYAVFCLQHCTHFVPAKQSTYLSL